MEDIKIVNYKPKNKARAAALHEKYSKSHGYTPDHTVETYIRRGFEYGRNIFCALKGNGDLIGIASLLPQVTLSKPATLWLEIIIDSDAGGTRVIDMLFERMMKRALEIKAALPPGKVNIAALCCSTETHLTDYYRQKDFNISSVGYYMNLSLKGEIPMYPGPDGIEIRPWKLDRDEDIERYLMANNQAFPGEMLDPEEFRCFVESPLWENGTTFTAFNREGDITGSLIVYWNNVRDTKGGKKSSYIQSVFVLPPWRRTGIARCLMSIALKHLKNNGREETMLNVNSQNTGAIELYKSFGYGIAYEKSTFLLSI
jgi:Acetyltransferases